MDNTQRPIYYLKNVPLGLLLAVFLGPVGLLYASLTGGIVMITLGIIILSHPYFFPVILWWLISCIWSVYAIEKHNKRQLLMLNQSVTERKS